MSLDGVIEAPSWTAESGFVPEIGEAIGARILRRHAQLRRLVVAE
jgi:hypothetical protein